jgi:hypothetical protein
MDSLAEDLAAVLPARPAAPPTRDELLDAASAAEREIGRWRDRVVDAGHGLAAGHSLRGALVSLQKAGLQVDIMRQILETYAPADLPNEVLADSAERVCREIATAAAGLPVPNTRAVGLAGLHMVQHFRPTAKTAAYTTFVGEFEAFAALGDDTAVRAFVACLVRAVP